MTPRTQEQVVESEQPLTVIEGRVRQGHFAERCFRVENLSNRGPCLIRQERQENAIKPGWLRIGTAMIGSCRRPAYLAVLAASPSYPELRRHLPSANCTSEPGAIDDLMSAIRIPVNAASAAAAAETGIQGGSVEVVILRVS